MLEVISRREHALNECNLMLYLCNVTCSVKASALTLFVGLQGEYPACKNRVMRCWCGYLSVARCRLFAYHPDGPADATATPNPIISCLI